MKTHRTLWSCTALMLLVSTASANETDIARADSFLRQHNARQAIRGLSPQEKTAFGRALGTPQRTVDDRVMAGLVNNPVAWKDGPNGRQLLRSVIKSLPEVAHIPGAGKTLSSACNPNSSNFRGFGFEAIATAALCRYREPNGDNPRMIRMSADIPGPKGKMLESDGCAMFSGADRRERLVTMKSVSSENALRRSVGKAMSQLQKRNGSDTTTTELGRPGIFMLGYSNPQVLRKAQARNWNAAAQQSRSKLLVLAVNQLTGQVTRLASVKPTLSTVHSRRNGRPVIQPPTPRRQGQREWRPPTGRVSPGAGLRRGGGTR